MTLENLLRIGKLKAHAVKKVEIERLLLAAERALRDAGIETNGADTRFGLAYRGIIQVAMAAMLCNGYRPATSEPGHHQLLIQSLPKSAGIDPARVVLLDTMRTLRNKADYSGDPVSDAVALEALDEARRLVAEVREWIKFNRPELI
jgi:hypothetical protein